MGIDAFVHTTRYSLDLADEAMRQGVEREPFSDDLASAKWRYYRFLSSRTAGEPMLSDYGRRLAEHGAALIPTASLGYLDRQGAENPWLEPVAAILDPADIHWPADPKTGKHQYEPEKQAAYAALAEAEVHLDRAYFEAGCRYLAGSGADVWGTMPGISLHHELAAHASGPNRTAQRRIGFAVRYLSAMTRQTAGPPLTASLVRGSDRFGYYETEPRPRRDLDEDCLRFHAATMERHAKTRYSTV